jgi:hypothetical protein
MENPWLRDADIRDEEAYAAWEQHEQRRRYDERLAEIDQEDAMWEHYMLECEGEMYCDDTDIPWMSYPAPIQEAQCSSDLPW